MSLSAADSAQAPESEEIPNLMESMSAVAPLSQGEIVQGQVLKVTDGDVFVDLGLKSEAAIPSIEFLTPEGELKVQPGDVVDIWVERFDEETGAVAVSHRKAVQERIWEEIERSFHEETPLRGRVLERIKGGLVVDVGVKAFLPGSHADLRSHPNPDDLLGQEIECRVIKLNRKRGNVVVSRRQVLEKELQQRKAALLAALTEGAVLKGRIKNITDYGAFVDLGGLDGLLHITDLSWERVANPSEVVQVGQEIQVKVLKFDREKERISLGLKQLLPDPWENVAARLTPGSRAKGRVVSLTDYGAFVELEPGVEGLIHISEMSWGKRLRHPSKVLKADELVEVAILDVNNEQRRISLSLRQTLPDPWSALTERVAVGSVVRGRVRHFTDFGAFVEIEDGVDGLIHISNLSWTKNFKHPSELLHKGQEVEAVVLEMDAEKRRVALGLKQLQPDAWENFFNKTAVGGLVRGKVTRKTSFGVFVEIEEGIEGLCHVSEFDPQGKNGEAAGPKVGSELEFRVVRLNPEEKKIGLSLRTQDRPAPSESAAKPKESPPLSRMAEALSSAGITSATVQRAAGDTEQ
jgi:small subunit ribosomal protein S1